MKVLNLDVKNLISYKEKSFIRKDQIQRGLDFKLCGYKTLGALY